MKLARRGEKRIDVAPAYIVLYISFVTAAMLIIAMLATERVWNQVGCDRGFVAGVLDFVTNH